MTYAELQQRRERIEAALDFYDDAGCIRDRLIRALLDDEDPKLWSYSSDPRAEPIPETMPSVVQALKRYDRALSIAEKELGLCS